MNGFRLKKSFYRFKKWVSSFIYAITFSSLGWTQNAVAALNLELTQGVANRLPIAIVPFEQTETFSSEQDISQVIESDLNHSGQFKVTIANRQALPQPYTLDKISIP